MSVLHRIGARIKSLRGAKTQREVGEASGFSHAWISELERGTRTPTLEALDAIAVALGARVELVADADRPPTDEEQELLALWRDLDEEGQKTLREVAQRWARLDRANQVTLRGLLSMWSQSSSSAVAELPAGVKRAG